MEWGRQQQQKQLSSSLCLHTYIDDKVNKVNNILWPIRRTYASLDEIERVQRYEAFVGTHVVFSNCVMPPIMKHIEIIENVQERATSQILSVSYLSSPVY